MRTFIDKLLHGATLRMGTEETGMYPVTEEQANALNSAMNTAALPPPPTPKDFVKARSLLATSITRLMSRRDVLVKEIEDRSAELFETNRTLEALANAEAAIYEIGKNPAPTEAEQSINEAELAEILSKGDAGVYANPYVDMLPEDTTAEEDTAIQRAIAAMPPHMRAGFTPGIRGEPGSIPPRDEDRKSESLLREATPPSKGPVPYGVGFKPPGFA